CALHDALPISPRVWQAGVVLAGISAGSICWFTGGTTDSYGPPLQPVTDGLGLLPYGNGVHYDSEDGRRPLVHAPVAAGTLPETYCTDEGAGLVDPKSTRLNSSHGSLSYAVFCLK